MNSSIKNVYLLWWCLAAGVLMFSLANWVRIETNQSAKHESTLKELHLGSGSIISSNSGYLQISQWLDWSGNNIKTSPDVAVAWWNRNNVHNVHNAKAWIIGWWSGNAASAFSVILWWEKNTSNFSGMVAWGRNNSWSQNSAILGWSGNRASSSSLSMWVNANAKGQSFAWNRVANAHEWAIGAKSGLLIWTSTNPTNANIIVNWLIRYENKDLWVGKTWEIKVSSGCFYFYDGKWHAVGWSGSVCTQATAKNCQWWVRELKDWDQVEGYQSANGSCVKTTVKCDNGTIYPDGASPYCYGIENPTCTANSCGSEYSLSSCPDHGNCTPCTSMSTDCIWTTKYKLDSCKSGYKKEGTVCVIDTPATYTCWAGKYLPKNSTSCSNCPCGSYCLGWSWQKSTTSDQWKVACGAEKYSSAWSTSCSTASIWYYANSSCSQTKCTNGPSNSYYTSNSSTNSCSWECNSGYKKSWNSCIQDNQCSITTCSSVYNLTSCPDHGNCTPCTATNSNCSSTTKYRLDSCDSGYKQSGNSCVKDNQCSTTTCSSVYNLTSCPDHGNCTPCTATNSNCSSITKYRLDSCDSGYTKNGNSCEASYSSCYSLACGTVSHGWTCTSYAKCSSATITSTCDDWIWSTTPWEYSSANQGCDSCTWCPWKTSVAHGGSCTSSYESATVPYWSSCKTITSTCNNGNWSPSLGYKECTKLSNPCESYILTSCPTGWECERCPSDSEKLKKVKCADWFTLQNNNCAKCEAPAWYTEGLPPYGDCYNYSTTTACGKNYYRQWVFKCSKWQKCELGKCVDDTTYSWECDQTSSCKHNWDSRCPSSACNNQTSQLACEQTVVCKKSQQVLWIWPLCAYDIDPESTQVSCCDRTTTMETYCMSSGWWKVDNSYCAWQPIPSRCKFQKRN